MVAHKPLKKTNHHRFNLKISGLVNLFWFYAKTLIKKSDFFLEQFNRKFKQFCGIKTGLFIYIEYKIMEILYKKRRRHPNFWFWFSFSLVNHYMYKPNFTLLRSFISSNIYVIWSRSINDLYKIRGMCFNLISI